MGMWGPTEGLGGPPGGPTPLCLGPWGGRWPGKGGPPATLPGGMLWGPPGMVGLIRGTSTPPAPGMDPPGYKNTHKTLILPQDFRYLLSAVFLELLLKEYDILAFSSYL
jgi:hypothetical protein